MTAKLSRISAASKSAACSAERRSGSKESVSLTPPTRGLAVARNQAAQSIQLENLLAMTTADSNTMTSKVARVKSLFEVPEKYLAPRQFDIRIRVETVQQFTKHLMVDHILDIGCGDGSLSLPLLPRSKR